MSDYLHLPIGEKAPEIVTAVIEIPQGCASGPDHPSDARRHPCIASIERIA